MALNSFLALSPVVLLLAAFIWLDVFHLLRLRAIGWLMLLGGLAAVIAYPISGRALDALPLGFSGYSRFIAPWIEEALKGSIVVYLFLANRIGFKIDAALSGVAIGAGFAIVENIIYLATIPIDSPGIWLVRGAGTAIMHGGVVAIMAAWSHQLNEHDLLVRAGEWRLHPLAFIPGYLVAVAIHTAYNQFPHQPLIAMVLAIICVPAVLIAIFKLGAKDASNLLSVEREAHMADQPLLEAGQWPDTESGKRLRALAEGRPDAPKLVAMIHEYWKILGEIVLRAESCMVGRANGEHHDPEAKKDRERLVRLHELEGEFDRATLRQVKRALPFSRNDLWEIAELRQELHRK